MKPRTADSTKCLPNYSSQSSYETKDSDRDQLSESPYAEELKLIRRLQPPNPEEILSRRVSLGKKTRKYTLFLDLDETLVSARALRSFGREAGTVLIRPLAVKLLETLSPLYEIVIFTAAEEEYATQAVKFLDPSGKHVKKVLTKKHCLPTAGSYFIKDLRIIADREMKEMLIVDNSIISFAFQLANGIPVESYLGEEGDRELGYLITYLIDLYESANIVEENKTNIGIADSL